MCLARLALWIDGEETEFQRLIDTIHPEIFRSGIDSVIQTARVCNRQQQGLHSKDVTPSRRTPDQLAVDVNRELGRRITTYPWAVTENRIVTYPDDVRAAFQKDRFVLEEEVRLFRFQGDADMAGEFIKPITILGIFLDPYTFYFILIVFLTHCVYRYLG